VSISPLISSLSYADPAVAEGTVQASPQQQPASKSQTTAQAPEDTVQISQAAQIQQMAQQGDNAATIASSTGVPISEVDSDLGITTTSSSVPVAAMSSHGGGQPAAAAPASSATTAAPATTSASQAATPAPTLSVQK
jgi:hypothetical protein